MNIVTGCSGIDAVAYAATLLGMEIKGQIEIDSFCNTILDLRFPGVKRYKNIFDVRGDEFGAVDIFAAGIPCQPFSHAGKREGAEDDRYLWPEAIRIIRVMQPAWVIIENVDGIGSMEQSDSEIVMETETEICKDTEMVLETIRKDLEEAGYNSVAIIIPACSVEAPHQRYRYFIVAYRDCIGRMEGESSEQSADGWQQAQPRPSERNTIMGNSKCSGCSWEPWGRTESESENRYSGVKIMADSTGTGLCDGERTRLRANTEKARTGMDPESERCCQDVAYTQIEYEGRLPEREGEADTRLELTCENVAHSSSTGREECNITGKPGFQGYDTGGSNTARTVRTAQSRMGRNANGVPDRVYRPRGQENSSGILAAFEAIFTALLDEIFWPAGYGMKQHEYEPPRVATGVKNRTNRLKVLGNAIVWQQIFPILLAIMLIHKYYK